MQGSVRTTLATGAILVLAMSVWPGARSAHGQNPGTTCHSCQAPAQPCELTFGANGTVTDGATGLPVAGAVVTVEGARPVLTDSNGHYFIEASRPGTCTLDYEIVVTVEANGYRTFSQRAYFPAVAFPIRTDVVLFEIGGGVVERCTGDCDGDSRVLVSEVVTCVNIALGSADPSVCVTADSNLDGVVTVDELIATVNAALTGCVVVCSDVSGPPCPNDQYCELPGGTCELDDILGVCEPIPNGCPDVVDPVCGCDGVTYGNDCERQMAQVAKDRDGACEKCEEDADCRLFSFPCDGCFCIALRVDEPDPICDGSLVNCFVDPCDPVFNLTAFCNSNACEAAHQCAGFLGIECPAGQICIDNPNDDCDPGQGGADCGGVCVPTE